MFILTVRTPPKTQIISPFHPPPSTSSSSSLLAANDVAVDPPTHFNNVISLGGGEREGMVGGRGEGVGEEEKKREAKNSVIKDFVSKSKPPVGLQT